MIGPARIVTRTFSIWWRSLPQLLAIAALVHLPLLALKWWLHEGGEGTWQATFLESLPVLNLTVFPSVIEGLAVLLVFQRLRGEPADVGRSIRQGTRRLWTILAIAAVFFVAVLLMPVVAAFTARHSASTPRDFKSIGIAEFAVITIVIVLLLYSLVFVVSIPAAIVEGHGPFRALDRSRILTGGMRGRIFLTSLLFGLTTLVPNGILMGIVISIRNPTAALLAGALVDWLVSTLSCVLPIVLYHDLREVKEGIGIEELLKVFE